MGGRELNRVRQIALAMPEVTERVSHGEPCFVRDKRLRCYFHDDHNGDGRISLWCRAPADLAEELMASEPNRYFRPPASASGVFSGWIGIFLDVLNVPWRDVAMILEDAFRLVAPKVLVAQLEASHRHPRPRRQPGGLGQRAHP